MECEFAYTKKNIDYVLCKKEPEPTRFDREKLFHAVCAHQVECPKKQCHKLSAGWEKCVKLAESHQAAYESVFDEGVQTPTEAPKRTTRTRRKPQSED